MLTDDAILAALEDSDAFDFSSDDEEVDKNYVPGESTDSEGEEGDVDQAIDPLLTEISANQNLELVRTEVQFLFSLQVQ